MLEKKPPLIAAVPAGQYAVAVPTSIFLAILTQS